MSGVTKTEFYRDGTIFTNLSGAPFNTSFDTRSLANGSHTSWPKLMMPPITTTPPA
jgi:hypothetical protein